MTSPAQGRPGGTPPHNLPLQATELIGRDDDLTRALDAIGRSDVRVLTLTGAAGAGKTRLALDVAARALHLFSDGVFLVDVAPLSDPPLIVTAIGQTLGVRLPGGEDGIQRLKEWVAERQLLLVLDNFEQAVSAAPHVATLVAASPGLKVLVTSRAPLRLSWEHEFPVSPLELPDLERLPPAVDLREVPSVALLEARGRAVKPDFTITAQNVTAVAELCIHLDGLPLALELAAARLKVLSPRAILERLQSRLDVLAPAAQDQPARHQTLRAALDWSYELLTDQEQRLLRALSVFVGGWTIEAGEAVCASDNIPREVVLNLLAQLVDKSLVVADIAADGSVRYRLLETIREYAHDGAVQHGEAELAVQRHAAYFYAQAQQAEGAVPGTYSPRALGQLARERDNLRAALRWCADNGQVEQGVRIGSALWEAVEHLLAESESARPAAPPSSGAMVAGPLSPREREVAVLLGRGYTNRQLADELVIAEGTAERHVANILNKLSLSSRAQVAVWAVEHGLLAAAVPGTGSAG